MSKIPFSTHAVPLKRAGIAARSQAYLGKLKKRPQARQELYGRMFWASIILACIWAIQHEFGGF